VSTLPPDEPQQPAAPPPGGYGAPPPASYGAPGGYGGPPAGAPGGQLAGFGPRLVSGLVEYVVPGIIANILLQISVPLGRLGQLGALAFILYSKYLEGQTGQGFGKRVAKTRLVGELTGQPVGAGLAIGRYFVHIVDAIPCLLGFLWPLWDAKKQTFADKILKTVVVQA
jgi:uncharacterized RDD family membrane protein YckC